MKRFATEYPDFPILQVPLAKLQDNLIWQVALAKLPQEGGFVQVPLAFRHREVQLFEIIPTYLQFPLRQEWQTRASRFALDEGNISPKNH